MFVNDDLLLFLSDLTENEKQKEGDDLMTCFVMHVSLLSLHIFLETAVLQKGLSFTTHLHTQKKTPKEYFSNNI